jgi:perosamine synthetase
VVGVGAEPSTRVALFRAAISEDAIAAAAEVLRSGWLGSGEIVDEFETELGSLIGATHCVAVSSGTAALHMALRVQDLEPGTEVITTPLTWVSTHHAIAYERCLPVFADIDPETGNVNPASVKERLSERTGAILVVHYGGYPCDLDELHALANEAGVPLIEDCAQALGATYKSRTVGSGSNLQCFSFSPTKNLTAIDGGAVMTGDPGHAERLRRLRSLGMSGTTRERIFENDTPYRESYEMDEVGFRYELSELHAAIGLAQLSRLGEENERRREIAIAYRQALDGTPGLELLRHDQDDRSSAHHLFAVLAEDRDRLARMLQRRGIEVGVHFPRNELLEAGANGSCPMMDLFASRTLSLPLHPSLRDEEVETVIGAIREGW